MLIDKQAPPSDENISRRMSDHEILTVFRKHLFTYISPFSNNLRNVLQAVTETSPSEENNFIRKTESNFFIVVCFHFPHLSLLSSYLCKFDSAANEAPQAEKIFSTNSPSVEIFRRIG
jgi:hypothetical protein